MNESKSEASPSTRRSGNCEIPFILDAVGLLLMISLFFCSACVNATVGQGGPDDVSAGWASVQAFYRFTPAGVIVLIIALFMTFAEKISNVPSSGN